MLKLPTMSHNSGIDILRGLSILAVLLLHLNIHFSYTETFLRELFPRKLFSLLFWSGYYGVVVFFTLSGYLITRSAIKKWRSLEQVCAKEFYLLRAARILPLLVTLLLVLSLLHTLNINGFTLNTEKVSLGRALFSALTFQVNWLQVEVGYLPANWDVLWSISIEESFYLFFPLVCLVIRKEWQFVLLLLVFFVISPWARTDWFPGNELGDRNHLAYIDSLAIGCIVALATVRLELSRVTQVFMLVIGLALLVFIFYFRSIVYRSGLTSSGLNVSLLSLGTGMLVIWLHYHPQLKHKSWVALSWLGRFGKYSYEIYLTHMLVIIVVAKAYRFFDMSKQWLFPMSLLALVACYLLGKFTFHYFSDPLNHWIRKRYLFDSRKAISERG